jgi:hypothetical protein
MVESPDTPQDPPLPPREPARSPSIVAAERSPTGEPAPRRTVGPTALGPRTSFVCPLRGHTRVDRLESAFDLRGLETN